MVHALLTNQCKMKLLTRAGRRSHGERRISDMSKGLLIDNSRPVHARVYRRNPKPA